MEYNKLTTDRPTTNELTKLTEGEKSWLLKRYQGKDAEIHRESEINRLGLWAKKGYLVPAIVDLPLSAEQGPYLVLQWLDGCSLTSYLTSRDRTVEEKIDKLKSIVKLFYSRQQLSQNENSYHFIHHDPNTGNIILVNNDFYYIDFEAQVSANNYGLIDALSIELAKFIRWSIRDIGNIHLDEIIKLTIEIYKPENPILVQLIKRVYSRRLQFIHRWKDTHKKNKRPAEVTKYDLADRFQYFLSKAL